MKKPKNVLGLGEFFIGEDIVYVYLLFVDGSIGTRCLSKLMIKDAGFDAYKWITRRIIDVTPDLDARIKNMIKEVRSEKIQQRGVTEKSDGAA